ncbi:ATP-binding protein [Aneurinibacillus sp. Ricciae_BoGa-3]|uniref:ATP-binding protein n=1 Tax=Aneurinibacillus sp. Ricciae_BoGa-3 TaxID=3022697 RepID=UPI0023425CF4|nr:ATP-binding protein [Aneurinibacillus sp. Ricciae_BoGa-3]WCK53930.1 ATP-binding protein [Aneurinibacillus sp. Ricciae_BoGa-3]
MYELQFRFKDLGGFSCIRRCISEYIRQVLPEEGCMMDVAVNEAVNNAINNGRRSGEKFITLKMRIMNGNKLIIRVKDEGPGFAARRTVETFSKQGSRLFDKGLLDESGRGIKIMLTVADSILYNRIGNEVMIIKRVPAAIFPYIPTTMRREQKMRG